ncbi:MAG: hypothetical protein ABRQ39_22280 [Candidatus Eremiobacterota bacterium]
MNKYIILFLTIIITAISGCQFRPVDMKDIKKSPKKLFRRHHE